MPGCGSLRRSVGRIALSLPYPPSDSDAAVAVQGSGSNLSSEELDTSVRDLDSREISRQSEMVLGNMSLTTLPEDDGGSSDGRPGSSDKRQDT